MDGSGPADERLDLRAMLRLHEGLRLKPYEDTEGHLTIGYGHNLDAKGITRLQAELILTDDIADAAIDLRTRWPWTDELDEVRRAVLHEMCFNMGGGVLAQFKTTLRLVQEGNYAEASRQMLRSKWASQVGADFGERAWRLSRMMATGEWPTA